MTLGAVVIVKDEEARIDGLLDNLASVCDGPITIVDTGSTDSTIERIEARGLTLHHRPFADFGTTRSEAFALARGTADWLLATDADMTWAIDPDFEADPAIDAYMVKMGTPDFEYRLPLLLRGDLPWESRGAVHEYTTLPDRTYISAPTDKVRVSYPHDRSSREKSLWHASLLEAELAEQPDNGRDIFYLAQTYADLGDPRTLGLYQRRAAMPGWPEETFYAKYRAALLLPWPDRLVALLAAWEFRPTRLEPLYEAIKQLNALGQHYPAYQLAQVEVVPTTDQLFVHTNVWRWGMMFERAIAAWWVGHRDECRDLTERVLAIGDIPPEVRAAAEANLALC